MTASRKGSTYAKNTLLEIFGLLWEETDYQHGLTIEQIHDRLIDRHAEIGDFNYQPPSSRTIREQLNWLSDPANTVLGRPVSKVNIAECEREGITDFTPGWYMMPYFDIAEMHLLADSLMLTRINDDMVEELSNKIAKISGRQASNEQILQTVAAFERYNTDFLYTIEGLDKAIRKDVSVTFEYCDYTTEGILVPRKTHDSKTKHYPLDPYRLIYKTGRYYIIGHLHGSMHLSCFIVDRIRNLIILNDEPVEIRLDQWQEDGSLRPPSDTTQEARTELAWLRNRHPLACFHQSGENFDPVKFTRQRPYLTMGIAIPITMVIKANILSTVFEWFDEPHIIEQREGKYIVQVTSPELAMLWWTLQYSDGGNIYILSPQSLRNRLYETAKFLMSCYGPGYDERDALDDFLNSPNTTTEDEAREFHQDSRE